LSLESWYKIKGNAIKNFGKKEEILKIIAISMTQQPIHLEELSPVVVEEDGKKHQLSWESLMIRGSIYVIPEPSTNNFRISFPPIVASMLSDAMYLFEFDLLQPIKTEWNWKKFELMEPIIDAAKTNIFVDAGYDEIEFAKFYGSVNSMYLDGIKMKLQKVTVANELHQFLPKNKISNNLVESDQGNFGSTDDRLCKYSFLCAPGNPSIDSRIYRKVPSKDNLLMICKQTKHTIASSELTFEYLKSQYERWRKYRIPFEDEFFVVYVLFSNRNCSEWEIQKFLLECKTAVIICKVNLEKYLPSVLACYADLQELNDVFREEYLKKEPTNDEDEEMFSEENDDPNDGDYVTEENDDPNDT